MRRCQKDQRVGTSVSPGHGHAVKVLCSRVYSWQHQAECPLIPFSHCPREDKPPLLGDSAVWACFLQGCGDGALGTDTSREGEGRTQVPLCLRRVSQPAQHPCRACGCARSCSAALSLGPGSFQVQGRFLPAQRYPIRAC